MKKPTSLIVGLLAMCTAAWADDKVSGWNIGPLPCVSYNSDLGFQYGVCADAFIMETALFFLNMSIVFMWKLRDIRRVRLFFMPNMTANILSPG